MEGPLLRDMNKHSNRWMFTFQIARREECFLLQSFYPNINNNVFPSSEAWLLRTNLCHGGQEANTLEGLIPSKKVAKYKDKVHEGVVYTIKRFDAIKAREKYKAVDHSWRFCFTQRTTIEPVVPQPKNFLMLACTLLSFSQLENRIKQNIIMSG